MDYVELERDFYKNYVIGGDNGFDHYLERKRRDGVWGDDLEIQALSEIYGLPIEIYAYSNTPMRTFHEVADGNLEPIRLSYHGRSHYNSIKSEGKEEYKIIEKDFGQLETIALREATERKKKREELAEQQQGQNSMIQEQPQQ
jgi:OTU domain-containing protein 5